MAARAPHAADRFEQWLAIAAVALFAVVCVALLRGRAEWGRMTPVVAAHLLIVLVPLALTPFQLLRPRGDRWHRVGGWIWAMTLFGAALISFGVRVARPGQLSLIHVLSAVTVVAVPLMVLAARRHDLAHHRRAARLLVLGALLIAGWFTLMPGRLLGNWLWQ